MNSIERGIEKAIFGMRWLLAPFFLGLFIAILAVLYKFVAQLYVLLLQLPGMTANQLIIGVLKLVDLALIVNLILIAIFAAHGNLVRKLDPERHPDWPDSLTRQDVSGLRQKLLGSIVAIATIETLEWYFDLESYSDLSKLPWVIGFQLAFIGSALMLALADRLTRDATHP